MSNLASMLLKLLFVAIGCWLLLMVLIYFFQGKLLFFPQRITSHDIENIKRNYPEVEELTLKTADRTKLHGWFIKAKTKEPAPLIIYFDGNAGEVSLMIPELSKFHHYSIALINYRGYGLSEGVPTQDALFSDATSIYDQLIQRSDVDKNKVVAMGRSLGTGVAVYLAENRPLKGAILISPYDSITSIGQRTYPFLPVSLLMRNPFNSLSRAPKIKVPMLCVVASDDRVVPVSHSTKFYDAWAGKKQWHLINHADHNNLLLDPTFWPTVANFLDNLS